MGPAYNAGCSRPTAETSGARLNATVTVNDPVLISIGHSGKDSLSTRQPPIALDVTNAIVFLQPCYMAFHAVPEVLWGSM